ncbi:MAG: hypothetical protein ACRC35_13650 [Angustibacter sp.]
MTNVESTPASLAAVHEDDQLLDRIAARRSVAGEPVAELLYALSRDVDTGLPQGIDHVAVAALAAQLAQVAGHSRACGDQEGAGRSVADPVRRRVPQAESVFPVGPDAASAAHDDGAAMARRRRRVLSLSRGSAALASFGVLLGSAGVSAAVTGDPVGAFGLRSLVAIVSPARSLVDEKARWLRQRIDLAAERPGGASRQELEQLRAEADQLPAEEAQELRKRLDSLLIAGPSSAAGRSSSTSDTSWSQTALAGGAEPLLTPTAVPPTDTGLAYASPTSAAAGGSESGAAQGMQRPRPSSSSRTSRTSTTTPVRPTRSATSSPSSSSSGPQRDPAVPGAAPDVNFAVPDAPGGGASVPR